jgi:hypothetical protein
LRACSPYLRNDRVLIHLQQGVQGLVRQPVVAVWLKGNAGPGPLLGKSFGPAQHVYAAIWAGTGHVVLYLDGFAFDRAYDGGVHVAFGIVPLGIIGFFAKLFLRVGR